MKQIKLFGKEYVILNMEEVKNIYIGLLDISSKASVLKENISQQMKLNAEEPTDDWLVQVRRVCEWDKWAAETIDEKAQKLWRVFY